jgi:hypothetical protein
MKSAQNYFNLCGIGLGLFEEKSVGHHKTCGFLCDEAPFPPPQNPIFAAHQKTQKLWPKDFLKFQLRKMNL